MWVESAVLDLGHDVIDDPQEQGALILKQPEAQFKDKDKKVPVTDRDTGAPMVEVAVALMLEGSAPQLLRVSVPTPGVPQNLNVGGQVKATGLTFITGEKDGRWWTIFRASALTAMKSG